MIRILLTSFILLCSSVLALSQNAKINGTILNENGGGIPNASIHQSGSDNEVYSDSFGNFRIELPIDKKVNLRITAFGYEIENKSYRANATDNNDLVITMRSLSINMKPIIIDSRTRVQAGMITLDPKDISLRPDPTGGVEGLLKILVGSRNETSSQYSVRGGNYDENLVYVNDFEIYRPLLVRSGQQEGLSFVNPDLVGRLDFSTGGFQSKYGDKLSSVLDIQYKQPSATKGSIMLSLLGIQGHLEGVSNKGKFTYLIGVRQKNNQYFLQSQPTKGQYNPSFLDVQSLIGYKFNNKWGLEAIGNYSRNRFSFIPTRSVEHFGFFNNAYKFTGLYEGSETDQFDAAFAGIALKHTPNDRSLYKVLINVFQTNEFETYDLSKTYLLTEVETDLGKNVGEDILSLGSGTIMSHARNYLKANVTNLALKGSHAANRHFFQWGTSIQRVSVDDKLYEWELRDSAGYTQPDTGVGPSMYRFYQSANAITYGRITAFIQDNIILNETRNITLNIGIRTNYSLLNDELIISPRAQFSYIPKWKKDIVFRLATGLYAQPPFYREMRDYNGPLNTQMKAQKSYHLAGGFDYNFVAWGERPFKLTGEVFYKFLWDLVPYEYQNVRIRYFPNNTAIGYAYGGEVRLFGDLVKDAESWISLGYLKTENKILKDDGQYSEMMARPTDQRAMFGMYFSDYLPRNKNFKVFLNLMYATGLPFSVTGKEFDKRYQMRIPDYKRVDAGFATLLLDGNRRERPYYSLFSKIDDAWLSLEVFNMLGILNTLSYEWVRPTNSTTTFAVPNRLTSRLINLKLSVRF